MYFNIRSRISHATRSLQRARAMSSLAAGSLLPGSRWDYRIVETLTVRDATTHASTIFKASVIPRENTINAPQWAIIKTASHGDATATENLNREAQSYLLPGVASATCFRQLYDVVDKDTLALEWLDTTLQENQYQPDTRSYVLIKAVLEAALRSCVILGDQKYVNTDYKPANILLSGIETGNITAKVGDLGLVFPAGHRVKAQPYAMRAPEVFLGQACAEPSQVWAVAATVLCWVMPGVLGVHDCPHFLINEAWCMAKIKRLFPDWNLPSPEEVDGLVLQGAVQTARRISEEEPEFQATPPFEEETQKVEMPQQLRELLRLMLVPDPSRRPSASSVLASSEFQALDKLVTV
ncbi:hypothetical protein B0T19DRAFT_422546 [Cercophora scortea]|uniref:Protein kinase domain-containing protein n=1 Tax=Cercophora scortea TaxID=314031 RepID=A0AAE0IMJ7_9PEZI|nr:hypothetical protein B0T19DRAFT_422546 [Cercophora scortea]